MGGRRAQPTGYRSRVEPARTPGGTPLQLTLRQRIGSGVASVRSFRVVSINRHRMTRVSGDILWTALGSRDGDRGLGFPEKVFVFFDPRALRQ